MRTFLLCAAIGVLAAPATAQTSTTDCSRDWLGNVHCTTHGSGGSTMPTVQADPNAFGSLINSIPDTAGNMRDMQAAIAARRAKEQVSTAARMIAGGDCAGAERYALSEDNFDLAREVKAYCAK